MRFNIPSKVLSTHLNAVSKVVNSKNSISILDNFLFVLNENELVITGSDQETTLTTVVPVLESEGEGKFAVNVKWILDLLKELPDQALTFEINDDNLEINIFYLNGKFNFIGINGDEFPQKENIEEANVTMVLPSAEIAKGIDQTIFAVGVDDLRPQMMGILWDIKPNEITFVASDTHKLVRCINSAVVPGIESSFILPTKPASILRNILQKNEGEVKLSIDSTSATFELSNYTMNCRFVKGKYPNYNSVIPTDSPFSLIVERQSLLNAVRRVAVFANGGGLVKLEIHSEEIRLKVLDMDFSTSAEETVACDYKGEDMIIGFNSARIIEVLNNISADTILAKFSGPSRAGIFLPLEQKDNEDILVLIMPMVI